MNTRPSAIKPMLAAAAGLGLATTSEAAINLVADTPLDTTAAVFTTDEPTAARGIAFDRQLRQSFKLTQDLTVTDIILGLNVSDEFSGMQMRIYEVDDVNAVPFAPAGDPLIDLVLAEFSLEATANMPNSDTTIQIQFTDTDQFMLPGRDGAAGYAIEFSTDDDLFLSNLGTWAHSNTGIDLYTDGEYYTESGGQGAANRDYNLSIGGIVSNVGVIGDTDGDGDVDDFDLLNAISNFTGSLQAGVGDKGVPEGDTDDDMDVDDFDLLNMISGFTGSLSSPVPEPASAALLTLGGLLIARRRR